MKVGVDCHVLAGKFQGSRTYLSNLYKSVVEISSIHEFIFFGHWDDNYFGDNYSHINYLSSSRLKRLSYQTQALIKPFDLDIMHSNYISPLILPCKSLLTVHDILFETHPQFFRKSEVIRNRMLVKRSVKSAELIHTVSGFSRQALIDIYHVPEDIIHIVPNGVDLDRFRPAESDSVYKRVENLFQIRNYILSVGRLEPRKNHVGLLRAYALVRQVDDSVGSLVIVGQRDFNYQDFFDVLDELGLHDEVKVLENITDDMLPLIYQAARLFVYPSFAEGFGIPPLEAMACGIPVVVSNSSALPEVVGSAGLLINPYNIEDIASAMLSLLNDGDLSASYAKKGRNQAVKWSWNHSAKAYLKSLEKV